MDRVDLLSARVPRYTSYPTAPHFHAGIGAGTYRNWLSELGSAESLSLYVHVPFCDTLCWFCGCHTRIVNTYSPVAAYLELLAREIDLVADAATNTPVVRHIHWGGGSPTLLAPADIVGLASRLRHGFSVADDAEFAIEIDPRGLSDATVGALAEAGVNRCSIGVQDCDETVQRAINRLQPFEVTASAVHRMRAVGIRKINLDVMYGLPHQTVAHVGNTLERVLALEPDRLAVFGYAHVPGFKKHQELIHEADLPGPEDRLSQYEAACAVLTARGYIAIGLDHFARPSDDLALALEQGRLHRNFQGYTTDNAAALVGLGASAIGSLPQGYIQNYSDVPNYRKAIMKGDLPVARGIALSDDDRFRRAIIEELMCNLHVDLEEIATRFHRPPGDLSEAFAQLEPLARARLITVSDSRIAVNPAERACLRLACAAFDNYLDRSADRHAVAV